jgi:nucleoside permease NupC
MDTFTNKELSIIGVSMVLTTAWMVMRDSRPIDITLPGAIIVTFIVNFFAIACFMQMKKRQQNSNVKKQLIANIIKSEFNGQYFRLKRVMLTKKDINNICDGLKFTRMERPLVVMFVDSYVNNIAGRDLNKF